MKMHKWTVGLAAAGLVTLPTGLLAEEQMNQVWTALSSTTISGYVNTSVHWNTGTGNGFTPAISYNGPGKQDGFNLNAVKVAIEKPLDEAQWAAGCRGRWRTTLETPCATMRSLCASAGSSRTEAAG